MFLRIIFSIPLIFLPVISNAEIVINEIMYDPQGTDANAGGEWIEIFNNGAETVSLTDWKFFDSVGNTSNHGLTITIGSNNLAPDQYAIISKDTTAFQNFFTQFAGNLLKSSFTLSVDSTSKQETLIIRNSDLIDIDTVTYSSNQGANGDGNSLQKTASGWTAGSPSPGLTNTSSSGTTTTTADTATTTSQTADSSSSGGSSSISAHSSGVSLSQMPQEMEFEISAGRDRLTTVGSNLTFRAVPTKLQNMSEQGITYQWSFGDGTTGLGSSVSHSYKFAGDYSVVVNGSFSDKQAVSRAQVKVFMPDISLTRVSGGVEINNKSKMEINLEGWQLSSSGRSFIFPKDTLISAGKKITFADEITGINSEDVKLLNPMEKEFGVVANEVVFAASKQPESAATSTTINLGDIQAKINDVKNKLAQISLNFQGTSQVATVISPELKIKAPVSEQATAPEPSSVQDEAQSAAVFEAPKQTGIISAIFSWPIRGFNFIKHLFVEN